MTRARIQSVLLDADGPLIIVLRDSVEGAWLGNVVERGPDGDRYLCVAISAARLAQFRHGHVDLRAIFTESESSLRGSLFLPGRETDAGLDIVAISDLPPSWLPDEGFLLTDFVEPVAAEYHALASESASQNRPVLYLNFDPPNSSPHSIDADLLGKALIHFQKSIRYAGAAANRALSDAAKKLLSSPANYQFEAVATASNSFEVHLQAKMEGDAFGYTPHVRALQKLDEIVSVVENTEAALAVARENRGHFVTAIKALMQFVADSDIPLSYAWTTPQSTITSHIIRPEPARALYEQLVAKKELDRDERELVGFFHKIDDKGTWRLEVGDGTEHSGGLVPDATFNLHGIVIGSVTYSVHCLEILNETEGTGRESTALQMTARPVEITPLP